MSLQDVAARNPFFLPHKWIQFWQSVEWHLILKDCCFTGEQFMERLAHKNRGMAA
jgi:hypothetical protein